MRIERVGVSWWRGYETLMVAEPPRTPTPSEVWRFKNAIQQRKALLYVPIPFVEFTDLAPLRHYPHERWTVAMASLGGQGAREGRQAGGALLLGVREAVAIGAEQGGGDEALIAGQPVGVGIAGQLREAAVHAHDAVVRVGEVGGRGEQIERTRDLDEACAERAAGHRERGHRVQHNVRHLPDVTRGGEGDAAA